MAMSRMSNINLSNGVVRLNFTGNDVVDVNQHVSLRGVSKKTYRLRHALSEHNKCSRSCRWREVRMPPFCKSRRLVYFVPFASADDGITVNGTPQASSNSGMEEMRAKLNQSLQGENLSSSLVQSIHDAARAIELAIQEHSPSSKAPWFTKTWLGVDKHAWVKTLSYQASVHALLQAAIEISSRGERRERDTNIFVQRSLMCQCAPLENVIRQELSAKQPSIYEWFWSHQHSMVVTTYLNLFERDPHFTAATLLCWKGESSGSDTVTDSTLLILALSCFAAVKKLGSAKLCCSQFSSMVPDTIGRLMDMLLDIVPIQKVYYSMKDIGLHREFLSHFGPRAALIKYKNNHGSEEIEFWIDLVQNQLQRAIDREKIWSRLTTCESIEVLEKDLAIFGFFIALGRSTQSFLSANGVSTMNDHIEGIIRYLIGGSVLYYPHLSSISSYQLYVEVVCEELEWLPFYQSNVADVKQSAETKGKQGGMSHKEAIALVLDVFSYWMTSFIKYSAWLENPSNIKATRFLSKGHIKLIECKREVGLKKIGRKSIGEDKSSQGSETHPSAYSQLDSFDKALEGVEEALNRLEDLLQELHLSNSNTGKEHLKAACSDLERIRKLKKEAEFLEASFRAKAASLEQVMSAGADNQESELNEIHRFELLRRELIELEKRVQRSTEDSQNEEESEPGDEDKAASSTGRYMIIHGQTKDNFITKSIEKIKKTSTDIWQGTQLLAIDVAAAMVLLRRALTGDELTEKEKKALQRTLTDLASVVPIGVLMLLPVTAVGHAAMLAAIQRYVPSLIPSTYGPERLDLLRQLEKVKETETAEVTSDDKTVAITSSGISPQ